MVTVKSFLNNNNHSLSKMITRKTQFWLISISIILSTLCFAQDNVSIDSNSYTIDDIADGLIKAEAKFINLRLEYDFIHRAWNKPRGPMLVTEGVYAEKKIVNGSKRLRYLEKKTYYVSDINEARTNPHEDNLASFDGQATRILYRRKNSKEPLKPMKGYILAGYEKKCFPSFMGDPHTAIWYYAGRQLGQILKMKEDEFQIESQNEILNDIHTVKIVGTVAANPKTGESRTMKLWISPNHNFLPLKIQLLRNSKEVVWETVFYDLFQLSNGLWYPKKIQTPADPPGTPNPKIFQIYHISKISIDPIPEEFFTPALPPNTRVIDDILKVTYTTTK